MDPIIPQLPIQPEPVVSKHSILKSLGLLLIVLLVVVVAYDRFIQFKQDQLVETTSQDTSTWETYEDDAYGFSFQYPTLLEESIGHRVNENDRYARCFKSISDAGVHGSLCIRTITIESGEPISELEAHGYTNVSGGQLIGGKTFYSFDSNHPEGYCLEKNYSTPISRSKHLVFGYEVCDGAGTVDIDLRKVVETLEYIEAMDISNWRIYKNTNLGVEFKVPSHWIEETHVYFDGRKVYEEYGGASFSSPHSFISDNVDADFWVSPDLSYEGAAGGVSEPIDTVIDGKNFKMTRIKGGCYNYDFQKAPKFVYTFSGCRSDASVLPIIISTLKFTK